MASNATNKTTDVDDDVDDVDVDKATKEAILDQHRRKDGPSDWAQENVKFDDIKARYDAANQSHVLKYYNELPWYDQKTLLEQLDSIQVETLSSLLTSALEEQQKTASSNEAEIKPFSKPVARTAITADKNNDLITASTRQTGMEAIRQGQVAALVLAGGQGTRLGFEGPKGCYDIGLPTARSLFCMICERLVMICNLAYSETCEDETVLPRHDTENVKVPLYVMTSPINHDETVSYFEDNSYFGLPPDLVKFFPQGILPCLTCDGKIIMESPYKVAMAPDGNGGIYPALQQSGMLEDMKKRGVLYLHVFSIDNALTKPVDPVFMGYCIDQHADCGNKVVWKVHAHEKVGVVAEKDNKPCIVEYSDITTEMAERKTSNENENDRLVFGAGNICNHFYTLDFIETRVLPNMANMYHVAHKKIPYHDDETKKTVTPTTNNGVKLESFIFDVFPLSTNMAVLDVVREEEFAPVKNAPGSSSDSPVTARAMISSLSKKWVQDAGGKLIGNVESDLCEVSPLTSYAGEGLELLVKGREIECPFYL